MRQARKVGRKVTRDQVADGMNTRDRTGLKPARAKMVLHQSADSFPFGGPNPIGEAPIRDYLDMAVRQLNVDEDAIVPLGIPDPEVREHLERPRARRQIIKDV